MRKFILGALSVATLAVMAPSQPTQAQILMVTGEYRVTEVDQKQERFGVALKEARPDVTQNWVYVSPGSEIQRRLVNKAGWHKDEKLNYYQFFEQVTPGTMLRVHGGRRWDGGISAKKVWIGFPEKNED